VTHEEKRQAEMARGQEIAARHFAKDFLKLYHEAGLINIRPVLDRISGCDHHQQVWCGGEMLFTMIGGAAPTDAERLKVILAVAAVHGVTALPKKTHVINAYVYDWSKGDPT